MSDQVATPERVESPDLSEPIGLYSHGFLAPPGQRLLAVAGQLAVGEDGKPLQLGFAGQMEAVLESLSKVLAGAGGSFRSILKFTTYLVSSDDIGPFYETRARLWPRYFGDAPPPPNTLLVVQRLVQPEFRIEIEALACVSVASPNS